MDRLNDKGCLTPGVRFLFIFDHLSCIFCIEDGELEASLQTITRMVLLAAEAVFCLIFLMISSGILEYFGSVNLIQVAFRWLT